MLPPLPDLSVILFDVDGTLIDSNGAHAETWAEALRADGYSCQADEIRPLVGMGTDKLLPRVAGIAADSEAGRALVKRKKALFEQRLPHLRPTRGARALVAELSARGKLLVVATSADEEEMRGLLSRAGVDDLLPRRTSSDDAARSKPDPDIVRAALDRAGGRAAGALLIGDTPYDIEAAHRAGIAVVALRSGGYWTDGELAGAAAVFDHPQALLEHWRSMDAASAAG
jgi:HAD superfamily hydrolase (TIGR01509 family)